MYIFVIDVENRVRRFAASEHLSLAKRGYRFRSANELAKLSGGWPAARLAAIWNKLPSVTPVRRFSDRQTAVQRIWKAIQDLETGGGSENTPIDATRKQRVPKTAAVMGSSTKTERIIALLKQDSGATLKDIMEETGWQRHSVRGFISRLSPRFGFRVRSFKRDGERVYRIR